jgi:hypothetical protein
MNHKTSGASGKSTRGKRGMDRDVMRLLQMPL